MHDGAQLFLFKTFSVTHPSLIHFLWTDLTDLHPVLRLRYNMPDCNPS